MYGVVLIGLALIKDRTQKGQGNNAREGDEIVEEDERESIEKQVERVTSALSAFVLPMIRSLGALGEDDISSLGRVGDDD